ncbi:hypothetical protein [Blastococcus sp. SYSU DS0973]
MDQHHLEPVVLVVVAAAGLAGVAAGVSVIRTERENRRWRRQLLGWAAAERAGRALPRGLLRPEHRTPFDAHGDADFVDVAEDARVAATVRTRSVRLVAHSVPAVVAVLAGAVGVPGIATEPLDVSRVVFGVFAGVLGIAGLVAVGAQARYLYGLDRVRARLAEDVARLPRASEIPEPPFAVRVLIPAVLTVPFALLLIHRIASSG